MITVNARCTSKDCVERNGYRMVGACRNCHTQDILVMLTAGHRSGTVDCPVCGCYDTVSPSRLATDEEIPVA